MPTKINYTCNIEDLPEKQIGDIKEKVELKISEISDQGNFDVKINKSPGDGAETILILKDVTKSIVLL